MKRILFWVVGIGLFVGLLVMGWSFRANNATPVELDLIWIRVPGVELWRIILASVAIGGVFAGTFVGFGWLRVRLENRRYRKAIRRLEAELHEMRSLPLSDGVSDGERYSENEGGPDASGRAAGMRGSGEGLPAASSGGRR